jgi:1,4-dihydroxy-6-naphthoate synthase
MKITLAFSPDTDDQFMVQALRERRIDWEGYDFEFIVGDIQELNDAARKNTYDITAISMAAYPDLVGEYWLMPVGSSIGDGFGPAVVTRPDCKLVDGKHNLQDTFAEKRIAVPGMRTSAFLAARTLLGAFTPVPMYFMDIAGAVKSGEVDGGILIHEMQIDCEASGLVKNLDLGALWLERFGLPLPLGGNAIRRSLGDRHVANLTRLFKASIESGLSSRQTTLQGAIATAKAKLDENLGDRYISMYVNHRSLDLQDDVLDSLQQLLAQGSRMGLYPELDVRSHVVSVNESVPGA